MKTAHIHLGPHRTGSTATQRALKAHADQLRHDFGLRVIDTSIVFEFARASNRGRIDETTKATERLVEACQGSTGDILISCEDISGVLPGRSFKRRPYPRLFDNIKSIRNVLGPFRSKFYFFTRDVDRWIPSAYAQILKHSSRFSSLNEYRSFIRSDVLWDEVLRKAREKLGDDLIEIPYEESKGFSSVNALLAAVLGADRFPGFPPDPRRPNSSPPAAKLKLYEAVNRSGASSEAQAQAKRSLQDSRSFHAIDLGALEFPAWPSVPRRPDWLSPELINLWERVSNRLPRQEQPDLLPDLSCDLSKMRNQVVTGPKQFPVGGRGDMRNQVRILQHRFSGLSELCFLLGLTISYLRRNTEHTERAAVLFQRLWEEEYPVLLGMLPTRWLISTFQTFAEHGASEDQRIIGASAYFFSNMLKAYEAERALDGLPPDRVYSNVSPATQSGFPGLDRFNLGGTDLILNTNALLLDLAGKDDRVGRVVQEFLLRTKAAHSVFSRMDRSRIEHGVDNPQFSNCWSFFQDPRSYSSNE